jgi:hypothetical protein
MHSPRHAIVVPFQAAAHRVTFRWKDYAPGQQTQIDEGDSPVMRVHASH